jgi:hypothetical protein
MIAEEDRAQYNAPRNGRNVFFSSVWKKSVRQKHPSAHLHITDECGMASFRQHRLAEFATIACKRPSHGEYNRLLIVIRTVIVVARFFFGVVRPRLSIAGIETIS